MFGTEGLENRLARFVFTQIRTATKRASGGKSANNSTAGRRLGPKKGEGEFVEAGQIIWRQRGTKWYPGENVGIGRDHTIFAREPGYVRYYRDPFHAKRRFIGVSLGASDRLPTPHFEPRRRRFGYTLIDNEEISQFERDFLTRKETQRLKLREDIFRERSIKQQQRLKRYASVLAESGIPTVSDSQLARLDAIYTFMCGGMNYDAARETVDDQALEDLDLDLRVGRVDSEEHTSALNAYADESAKVDQAVRFGPSRILAPVSQLNAEARNRAIIKIEELTKSHMDTAAGTPSEVVQSVVTLLGSTAAFSAAEIAHLKGKYLRRPSPILLSESNQKELEARVKKAEGELRMVWNEKTSTAQRFFVPKNARLVFE